MNRRRFISGFSSVLALPSLAIAQTAVKKPTLGLLYPNPTVTFQQNLLEFYSARLRELGWVVGENLLLENASSEGREDRLPSLAAALVAKQVDVIWVAGPEAAIAAARATKTIPIAFYGVGFPVEHGLVDSLARPGRNVTGFASLAGSEPAKGIELLKEVAPKFSRLAWIGVETVVTTLAGGEVRVVRQGVEDAAARLQLEIRRFSISQREDFDAAFAAIRDSRAQAMGIDFTALTFRERQRLADFAGRQLLPSVSAFREFVEAGGLLSYGANRRDMARRSFAYVDRILRGARPSELPIELPSSFELGVNLKTAKALGLTVPQSILVRADRVVE
jgi:putative ABC transport system substrate-binding protein